MKRIIYLFVTILIASQAAYSAPADQYTIDLARSFSKDIFDLNGVPYLSPMVEAVNATSNSRFYSSAYVPRNVKKPYFKVSLNGMAGLVKKSQQSYSPQMPMDTLSMENLARYGYIENPLDPVNMKIVVNDTSGLISYLFKTLLYDGYRTGKIVPPNKASTILGSETTALNLDNAVLQDLMKNHFLYQYLPQGMKDTLLTIIKQVPGYFTLPAGGNINSIVATVPQVEFGSLYGTEMLVRFIPPVDLGKYIGKFAFWGVGLKHSISQYFYDEPEVDEKDPHKVYRPAPFDMAAQIVYQGTHLENKVGVTQSDLTANANIWNFNLHFSKQFHEYFEMFGGFSYNYIKIDSDFKYYLPVETQLQLGLMKIDPVTNQIVADPPEYPGDTQPQTTSLSLEDSNIKFNIGAKFKYGPIGVFADYNYGDFNILSFGLEYRF